MRNRNLLKEVISQTLGAINEQEAVIQKYEGRIPQIEIDLIQENIRRLYENFHLLDKINDGEVRNQKSEIRIEKAVGIDAVAEPRGDDVSFAETDTHDETTSGGNDLSVAEADTHNETEPPGEDTSVTEMDSTDESEPPGEDTSVTEMDSTDESEPQRGDTLLADTDDINDDEIFIPKTSISIGFETKQKPDNDTTTETTQPNIQPETHEIVTKSDNGLLDLFANQPLTIADQYKTNETTLHDSITNGEDDSVASKMQKIPINDLKSHIGINDRFRFINELFLASMKDYDEAIDQLNNYDNQPEAIEYFNKITERYKMDQDLDSFQRLKDFILRKYL